MESAEVNTKLWDEMWRRMLLLLWCSRETPIKNETQGTSSSVYNKSSAKLCKRLLQTPVASGFRAKPPGLRHYPSRWPEKGRQQPNSSFHSHSISFPSVCFVWTVPVCPTSCGSSFPLPSPSLVLHLYCSRCFNKSSSLRVCVRVSYTAHAVRKMHCVTCMWMYCSCVAPLWTST